MPDFNNYLSQYPNILMLAQSALVARWIDEKPSTITIVDRAGSAVAGTQLVRIEPVSNEVLARMGENVLVEDEHVIVHGYKNATGFTDTNLKRGDAFTVAGMDGLFTVLNVVETMTDRLLATVKVK